MLTNIRGSLAINHQQYLLGKQGQPIALSGMVGQTIFPHLHFAVFNREETESLPIAFSEVRRGVPLAGQFCLSKNGAE